MDIPNAFVGKLRKPTDEEVSLALGSSSKLWTQFLDWLADAHGVTVQQWKSSSPKYGWSLRLKRKARNIVYLAPCKDCFRVAFVLGPRAVKAVLQSDAPKSLVQIIQEAPRYPEGTGVRLMVKKAGDLAAIRKLAAVKLAN
jgi:Protein of unknown function (DUF3788)